MYSLFQIKTKSILPLIIKILLIIKIYKLYIYIFKKQIKVYLIVLISLHS